jgi:hypothetical protein
MSSIPAPDDVDGFHVVVAEDGSLPASELARLGLRPGARLRLVPEPRPAGRTEWPACWRPTCQLKLSKL